MSTMLEALPAQATQHVEHLGLDGHVERRGRFIGDQQGRVGHQRHRNRNPLTLPAGKLVRILVEAPFRIRNANRAHQLERTSARLGPAQAATVQHELGQLFADSNVRRERIHRVLGHHAGQCATHGREAALARTDQLPALQPGRAQPTTVGREQAQAGKEQLALSGSRLANHAQALTAVHVERYAAHRPHGPLFRVELDLDLVEREQRWPGHFNAASGPARRAARRRRS